MADAPAAPAAAVPTPLAIPDYLKKYMVPAGAPATEADALVSSSMSLPRLSLRAKKFRWMLEGDEIKAEPETHVVILGVDPGPGKFIKTYYDGPYNPGDTSPPTCSSSDGVRPDPWVTTMQNDICATCPKNAFGSATGRGGKKAKACRDAKRLWVTPPDAIQDTVFALQTPVTSLKNLSDLGKMIKETGLPMSAAVVKLTMEDDESFPVINFAIAGWLHQEHGELAITRNEKKDWDGALKAPNPPVTAITHNSANQPAPVKVNADNSIEGTATSMVKTPDVDAALKTWG